MCGVCRILSRPLKISHELLQFCISKIKVLFSFGPVCLFFMFAQVNL